MASLLIGKEGRGFAFEPNPEIFPKLRRRFVLNHTSNVEPVPLALSHQEAETDPVPPTGSSALSSLASTRKGPERSFEVRTTICRERITRSLGAPETPTQTTPPSMSRG